MTSFSKRAITASRIVSSSASAEVASVDVLLLQLPQMPGGVVSFFRRLALDADQTAPASRG
jgi:hypothetical protein